MEKRKHEEPDLPETFTEYVVEEFLASLYSFTRVEQVGFLAALLGYILATSELDPALDDAGISLLALGMVVGFSARLFRVFNDYKAGETHSLKALVSLVKRDFTLLTFTINSLGLITQTGQMLEGNRFAPFFIVVHTTLLAVALPVFRQWHSAYKQTKASLESSENTGEHDFANLLEDSYTDATNDSYAVLKDDINEYGEEA